VPKRLCRRHAKKKTAKEKGATGWLNKPFNEEKMLTTISRVLA